MNGKISAGILMYRRKQHRFEVLLAHPGGPYGANPDDAVWNFPKGIAENGETKLDDLLQVARREFEEELGFPLEGEPDYLGLTRRARDRETVHIWTVEGDCDTACVQSNIIRIEHPEGSGTLIEIPEIDRAEFFTVFEARKKITSYLVPILNQFTCRFGQ